ncbi:MAG: hypothetical protein L3J26_09155 [Candidatus Polarisedimenticolaceae bacterium]|nr:hypothetical protein [Candidatus Polarisedimenticolaceae bacterium]
MTFSITKTERCKNARLLTGMLALFFLFVSSFSFASVALAYNIVILTSKNAAPYNSFVKEFKKVLPDSTVKVVNMEEEVDKGSAMIRKITEDKTDLIVALGSRAAWAAKDRQDIPVMFSMLSNPKKYEIDSRAGIRIGFSASQKMQVFREILPRAQKIGVLYGKDSEGAINDIKEIADKVGITIIAKRIDDVREVASAVDDLLERVDALWLRTDKIITSNARLLKQVILLRALRKKIPIIGENRWTVQNGALFSLFASYQSLGAQAGELVERLMEEGEFGFQYPSTVNVLMNSNVAERLSPGVNIVAPRDAFFIK